MWKQVVASLVLVAATTTGASGATPNQGGGHYPTCHVEGTGGCSNNGQRGGVTLIGCVTDFGGHYQYATISIVFHGDVSIHLLSPYRKSHRFVYPPQHSLTFREWTDFESISGEYIHAEVAANTHYPGGSYIQDITIHCCDCGG